MNRTPLACTRDNPTIWRFFAAVDNRSTGIHCYLRVAVISACAAGIDLKPQTMRDVVYGYRRWQQAIATAEPRPVED